MIVEEISFNNIYYKLSSILGNENLSNQMSSPLDFISVASIGINSHAIDSFRKYFNFPRNFVAAILNVSEPTIYRWIKANKTLDRNTAVQLLELSYLFIYGAEVFSNNESFFKWLHFPNIALGGMMPKDLLDIPDGVSKVRDLLGRIEFGVYS